MEDLKQKLMDTLDAIPEKQREEAAKNAVIFLAGCRSMTAKEDKR